MNIQEIIHARLVNQKIAHTTLDDPAAIVKHMVAMQAQEYAMAKWAIGLRVAGVTEADVDRAFNEGAILRTHIMRPTWHFVAPEDIRWMIALTAPRVNAINAFMYRKCEIDEKTFNKSNDVLIKTLEGGKNLTRNALKSELDKEIITGDGVRLSCLMMKAELDGLICSGPREGKQFTYALLDERVPAMADLTKEASLARLALRYFSSRSPAQLQDFVMWSGLTVKDAKDGISSLPNDFIHEQFDGQSYIHLPVAEVSKKIQSTFLMPDYDEYGMSYKDRAALFSLPPKITENSKLNIPYNRMIIVDGQIVGSWKRTLKNKAVDIETDYFKPINKKQQLAVERAVRKYSAFVGKDWIENE